MMTELYKKTLLSYPFILFFLIAFGFILSEQVVEYLFGPYFSTIHIPEHLSHFLAEIPMLYVLLYAPLRKIVRDYTNTVAQRDEQAEELMKFSHVIQQSADLVMITDRNGVIEYVNDAYPITTGYDKETFIGATPAILKSTVHSREDYTALWRTILSGHVYQGVIQNKRMDATLYYEEKTITPIRLEKGKITHFISTGKDITEKISIQKALEESEYLFKILAESSLVGIFMYQENYVYVNHAFEEMTGYTEEELLNMETAALIHPEDRDAIRVKIEQRLAGTLQEAKSYNELRIIRKDGSSRWVYATIASVIYRDNIAGLGSIIDISERKELEHHLNRLATTDKLTSLMNRTRFDEIVKREIACVERYQTPLSLILFDIDHFKKINDRYGHDVGDGVLIQLAKIGMGFLRETDIFVRWGGEEFLILCPHTSEDQAYLLAERFRKKVQESAFASGEVTISAGVSEYVLGELIEQTIKRADVAMYDVKKSGRNGVKKGKTAF